MQVPFVDLKIQYVSIKEEVDTALSDVIGSAAYVGGRFVKEFEQAFANFCDASFCIGVGNGTDALYIALRALGIGPGDEVITVANSFIATAEAITLTGARVVFVDCPPDGYNIDVEAVEHAVTSKTKAIVPVHLYGEPADMISLQKIARKHGLYLVEDAAQAHGAKVGGLPVGTLGDIACFSFYPGKNLGAYGDAGAIVTNREDLATRCRMIANHGRVQKYDHEIEGVNSRLDGLQAAVLSVKLRHLEEWTEKRRAVAAQYRELLVRPDVVVPEDRPDIRHVYHLFVVRIKERDRVQARLKEAGISTGVHYPIALPNLGAYRYLGHSPADFPVASMRSEEILSLPMYPELGQSQVTYVCEHLVKAIKG